MAHICAGRADFVGAGVQPQLHQVPRRAQRHLLSTPYSLTEARVLFELGQRDETEVAELRRAIGLDAGYLSRLLGRFEDGGLVRRERSTSDARRQLIRLTSKGRDTFRVLDTKSVAQIRALLGDLTDEQQQRLVDAMDMIRRRLARPTARPDVRLRPPAARATTAG